MLDHNNHPTAAVVLIGNELLQGEVQDSNLHYIATALRARGVRITEARVIADDKAVIVDTVNHLRTQVDYVFATGGIGPTHDDITTASVARAFSVKVVRNQAIAQQMRARKANVTEATLRMADIPDGACLIDNPISIAPGFRIDNVFVLAGVPEIMQAMLHNALDDLPTGAPLHSEMIYAFVPESHIAATLEDIEQRVVGVTIGSYPTNHQGRSCVRIVLRGYDAGLVQHTTKTLAAILAERQVEIQPFDSMATTNIK